MDFSAGVVFFLSLITAGFLIFSVAAGFSLYPVLVKKLYSLLVPSSGAEKVTESGMPRPFDAFRVETLKIKFHRKILTGNIYLPEGITPDEKIKTRILVIAPDGNPETEGFSLSGLSESGAEVSGGMVFFVPAPVEKFHPGKAFSFGLKEGKALRAWEKFFRVKYPEAEISFYGRFCGAASVLFCAARCGKSGFLRIFSDSPYFSVPDFMRKEIAAVFPGLLRRRLIFCGVVFASCFSGGPVFFQRPCRVVEKLSGEASGFIPGKKRPEKTAPRISLCFNSAFKSGGKSGEFFSTQYTLYKNFFLKKKKKICDRLFFVPRENSEETEVLSDENIDT